MTTATYGNSGADVPVGALQLGTRLGQGGQGDVFLVTNRPGVVYKRYHNPALVQPDSLAALVRFPGTLTAGEQEALARQTSWPLARVTEKGQVIGFLMKQVPQTFVGHTAAGTQLRELQYLLYEPKPTWGDIKPLDAQGRVECAKAFARLVQLLQQHSTAIGDISLRNLLWSPGLAGSQIFMIDCDGPIPAGLPSVLPQTVTPDWDDPLQPASGPDLDTDRYKLALLVGRVLSARADARPGQPLALIPDLPPRIASAVTTCFEEAGKPHGTRPDATRWIRALDGRGEIELGPLPPPKAPQPPLPKAPLHQEARTRTRPMIPMNNPRPPSPGAP